MPCFQELPVCPEGKHVAQVRSILLSDRYSYHWLMPKNLSFVLLRRTCRELVLQVVLRKAMKSGGDGKDLGIYYLKNSNLLETMIN